MTPGANPPGPSDWDQTFSQQLLTHSRSLRLTQVAPVGAWSYGQGIRRAHGDTFFWDLASEGFRPLGLNHPTELRPSAPPTETAVSFTADLVKVHPLLAEFRWTLLEATDPWLQNAGADACFREADCSLKCDSGWSGFERLAQVETWVVPLDAQTVWVASTKPLPPGAAASFQTHPWLRPFLSADALGPAGRLRELAELLTHALAPVARSGLIFTLAAAEPAALARRGLRCDSTEAPNHVRLFFPLAVLSEDIQGIQKLLKE